MPIYEFYCPDCHTVFSFLSRSVDTDKRPDCPRCKRKAIERRPSRFAVSRGLQEKPEGDLGDVDDERLDRAMASLAGELDGVDENDPRGAARLMRRLYESAGMPVGGVLEEALRRMESGEDPDAIDAEFGDALDAEDPFLGAGTGEKPTASKLARRFLPPRTDPELHEL